MKMVKSFILGSAAGLLPICAAQAPDLPVKAKAVEYVKIFSLSGAGVYYLPRTVPPLKVDGYVAFGADLGAHEPACKIIPHRPNARAAAVSQPIAGAGGADAPTSQ